MGDLSQQYTIMAVDELEPHPENPRRGDVTAIAESIDANGFYGAVIAQAPRDGRTKHRIIAGEHRWKGAQQQSIAELPVLIVDVDDDHALRIMLADNRTTDLSGYDDAALATLLAKLDNGTYGTGYDDSALRKLVDSLADPVEPQIIFTAEQIIDAAVEHYLTVGFPYPERLPVYESMNAITRLGQTETRSLLNSVTGYSVADGYHPHRFDVPIPGKKLAVDVFTDKDDLREMLTKMLDPDGPFANDNATSATIRSLSGMFKGRQTASNFRPGFALYVYRKFAADGVRVLDTSAGFGGRLVGFFASHLTHYTGIDPAAKTQAQNATMTAELCPVGKDVRLIVKPAEDVTCDDVLKLDDEGELGESFDLAFTSPPYFTKEQYSEEPTQSHVRYGDSVDSWVDGFLRPTMQLQHDALRSGATAVVNIADVKTPQGFAALVDRTVDVAVDAGFHHVGTESYGVSRVPGKGERPTSSEPVLVFVKP